MKPSPDRHWQIGPYNVELIRLGLFGVDAGAMFGIIPKALWLRAYPHCDPENRLQLGTFALLVRGNGVVLVADAGIGDKLNDKMRANFAVQQVERALPRALEARGIAPEDVTHFVYTHLHFDHCGGATEFGPGGPIQPVFPRAKHLVQASHFGWATNPSEKDRASFLPENWDAIVDAGLLVQLEGDHSPMPGIELRVVHGHTPGMQMVLVRDGDQGLLFSVDLFPTAAHLPLVYVPALDNHPLATLEEKRFCLEEVAGMGWTLATAHDPFTPPGKVVRDEMGRYKLLSPDSETSIGGGQPDA